MVRLVFFLDCLFWLLVFKILSFVDIQAQITQEYPLEPIKLASFENAQIVENAIFCHLGTGVQDYTIRLEGRLIHSQDKGSGFNPDIENSTYLATGCTIRQWFIEYFLSEIAVQTNSLFSYEGKDYNAIDLSYEAFLGGYSFPLWVNYFYLDLGIGRATSLHQAHFASGTAQYSSQKKLTFFPFWKVGFTFFISPWVFIRWQLEQSMRPDSILQNTNTLAIHIYRRF